MGGKTPEGLFSQQVPDADFTGGVPPASAAGDDLAILRNGDAPDVEYLVGLFLRFLCAPDAANEQTQRSQHCSKLHTGNEHYTDHVTASNRRVLALQAYSASPPL